MPGPPQGGSPVSTEAWLTRKPEKQLKTTAYEPNHILTCFVDFLYLPPLISQTLFK